MKWSEPHPFIIYRCEHQRCFENDGKQNKHLECIKDKSYLLDINIADSFSFIHMNLARGEKKLNT